MDDVVAEAFTQRRFKRDRSGAPGAVGAAAGRNRPLCVTAYAVRQRHHELGVRLALGAQRSAVVRMVLRESLRLVLAGGAGSGGALLLNKVLSTQILSAMLFEVKPVTPVAMLGASALLLVSRSWGVSCRPAAPRVDPMTTLRQE
jgi:putative ABC transport system permease protein